jgi:hypothetical protein
LTPQSLVKEEIITITKIALLAHTARKKLSAMIAKRHLIRAFCGATSVHQNVTTVRRFLKSQRIYLVANLFVKFVVPL